MATNVQFSLGKKQRAIDVRIIITGKSVAKIQAYSDNFFSIAEPLVTERLDDLAKAKQQFQDCICYFKESDDWEAYILKKDHTNKRVIELKVFKNYLRNIEEFVDYILIEKSKSNRKDIKIEIPSLLPDKDFAPIFVSQNLFSQIFLVVLTFFTVTYVSYLKFSSVDKKEGIDLLLLIASANLLLFFNTAKELYKFKGKPWIKK